MGRELRQHKRMHRDDWELQQIAGLMIMQMRNYEKTQIQDARATIEKSYMANLKWLAEWKRSKLAVVRS